MTSREKEETAGGCTRILDGFLTLRTAKGNRKRWVLFQGVIKTGIFQLKVFKQSDEKILKTAHTISKDTFVGLERGKFDDPRKSSQKAGHQTPCYLAILLVTDTLVFHDHTSNLTKWQTGVGKYFPSKSWEVVPMTGVAAPISQVVLHVTQHAMSLATTNPPKHYQRWALGRVMEYGVWGARVYFKLDSSEGDKGYYEMKALTPDQATRIAEAISCFLPHLQPQRKRTMSLDSSSLSPLSPGRRGTDQPGHASDDHLVFKYPSSQLDPARKDSSSSLVPPPVSPRPPSTLLSPPSPKAPSSSQSTSPRMLKINPPPTKLSPASPKLLASPASQPSLSQKKNF
ncbi:uncharacterized protein LOC110973679 isoform X2 [Acanthaster planci]|uniref:Uncharacterized protein LOC110973679 isoform X2 n=1 Tax=Acanthaster planci TaxID=133434 RepID=A0A8B7XHU3_ACAPL|nr:uncharacterized protein LOC110973679 isoform X2 [Acanthaster planci]